jgi:hypothetical protein
MTIGNSRFAVWKDAVASNDTFRFARVSGDKDLLMRAWRRLKEYGADPMSPDMLILRDVAEGINVVVEKAETYDRLEIILNRTDLPEKRVIEMLSAAFYG